MALFTALLTVSFTPFALIQISVSKSHCGILRDAKGLLPHSVVKVKGRYHFVAASCQPMFEYPITVDHGTVNVSVTLSDQPSEATISVNRVTLFSPTAALKSFPQASLSSVA